MAEGPENRYPELRLRALQLTPAFFGLAGAGASDLLAVLMDMGMEEGVATLVAVRDGATSLYLSSGGGFIGAGEHESVAARSKDFLRLARTFAPKASPAREFPLPDGPGHVRFYFVTGAGVLGADGKEEDLGRGRHAFSELFLEAHRVISSVREMASGEDGEAEEEEPADESGYCNALLLTMARAGLSRVEIVSGRTLPDLERLAVSKPETVQWLRKQAISGARLSADKVIGILMESAGMSGMPWASKVADLSVMDCIGEDGPSVERLYRLERSKVSGATCLTVTLEPGA